MTPRQTTHVVVTYRGLSWNRALWAGDAVCWRRHLPAGDDVTGDDDVDDDATKSPDDGPNGESGEALSDGYGQAGNDGDGRR